MSTNRETLKVLIKSIVNRLENRKVIQFPPRLRQVIQDEIYDLLGREVYTDEDLKEKALQKIGASSDALNDTQFSESEQYKAAKAIVRKSFGDDALHGFYFQKPLKYVAESLAKYFMRSSHIDDVYETDEEIEKQVVEIVQRFNPKDLH